MKLAVVILFLACGIARANVLDKAFDSLKHGVEKSVDSLTDHGEKAYHHLTEWSEKSQKSKQIYPTRTVHHNSRYRYTYNLNITLGIPRAIVVRDSRSVIAQVTSFVRRFTPLRDIKFVVMKYRGQKTRIVFHVSFKARDRKTADRLMESYTVALNRAMFFNKLKLNILGKFYPFGLESKPSTKVYNLRTGMNYQRVVVRSSFTHWHGWHIVGIAAGAVGGAVVLITVIVVATVLISRRRRSSVLAVPTSDQPYARLTE